MKTIKASVMQASESHEKPLRSSMSIWPERRPHHLYAMKFAGMSAFRNLTKMFALPLLVAGIGHGEPEKSEDGAEKLPDLVLESIESIKPIGNYDISYRFVIKNVGDAAFRGKSCAVQAWVTTSSGSSGANEPDGVPDAPEGAPVSRASRLGLVEKLPAGGLDVVVYGMRRLRPGGTYKGSFSASLPPNFDKEKHAYLEIHVDSLGHVAEKDETNNAAFTDADYRKNRKNRKK